MRQIYDIIISSKNCLSLGAFDGDTMIGFAEATLWDDSGMVKAKKPCVWTTFSFRTPSLCTKLWA
jgi:hypothetical protein